MTGIFVTLATLVVMAVFSAIVALFIIVMRSIARKEEETIQSYTDFGGEYHG